MREQRVAWDDGRSFAYEGPGIPMMKYACNQWPVILHGDKSLLASARVKISGHSRTSCCWPLSKLS